MCILQPVTRFSASQWTLGFPANKNESQISPVGREIRPGGVRRKDGWTGFLLKWMRFEQHDPNTDLSVIKHQRGLGWGKWVEQSNDSAF